MPVPRLPLRPPADARVIALFEGSSIFEGTLADARRAELRRYGIGFEGTPPRLRSAGGAQAHAAARGPGHTFGHEPGRVPAHTPGTPEPGLTPGGVLVELERVSFTYGGQETGAPVGIHQVDFRLDSGEVVALLGANGSGKSTLLQHLNGLLRPISGVVRLGGRELGRRPTGKIAATVGYLFQDTDQQLFERTVLREVAYGPAAAGKKREIALAQARLALAKVGLLECASLHPYELCFVRRRLVAMASMIATGPLLWVLDEPTAGLDDIGRSLMGELLLAHASRGGGVVLATHDVAFAEAVSNRTLTLTNGHIQPEPAAGATLPRPPSSQ